MLALKVTQVGNSLGLVLPKEAAGRLKVAKGDVVYLDRVRRRLPADALRPVVRRPDGGRAGDHEAASQCPARTRQVDRARLDLGGGRRRSGNPR